MSKDSKRAQKLRLTAQTHQLIKTTADKATFQVQQDAVTERDGYCGIEIDDYAANEVCLAKVSLMPKPTTVLAAAPQGVDVPTQLLRQQALASRRFEVTCRRLINSISEIKCAQIGIEWAIVNELYAVLQELGLQSAAQGVNPDEIASAEEASSALYRQVLGELLHLQLQQNTIPTLQITHTRSANSPVIRSAKVLLATAVVHVRDAGGVAWQFRALLDQGAEASFITSQAAKSLQLPRNADRVQMEGLGGTSVGWSSQSMDIRVSDRFGKGFSIKVTAFIIQRINNRGEQMTVSSGQQVPEWPHTADLVMADPDFLQPLAIDVLLGGEVYGKLLLSGIHKHAELPTAQNTQLGWIVSGQVSQNCESPVAGVSDMFLPHTTLTH